MSDVTTNHEQLDLYTLSDVFTPWAIRVAATLRIADLIAEGSTRIEDLATNAGADADALGRVLRHLICRGVFAEPGRGIFTLNPTAEQLRDDHPSGLRAWLDLDGMVGRMDVTATGLLDSVRTGGPVYAEIHGRSFWQDLDAHPDLAASFTQLMALKSTWLVGDIVAGYDWASANHVADIGGGAGVLITHVLRAHDGVRGTIVDRPETAAAARGAIASAGLADRCEVVAGSFFDPLPTGADRYVLWNVLHDWPDPDAARILRRCAEAAGPSGRVVVIEFGEQNAPIFTELNLRMLLFFGARERTNEEFAELGRTAGLTVSSTAHTPAGLVIVEFSTPPRQ